MGRRFARSYMLAYVLIQEKHTQSVHGTPDRCELLLDRRMVPGEDEQQARREIENLLETAEREFGVRAEIIEYVPTTGGATETAAEERIVQESLAASERHEGAEAVPNGFQGGCDLVHFRSVGATGTVIVPCGDETLAQSPSLKPLDCQIFVGT